MSISCEIPSETMSTCVHGVPVKFECGRCQDKHIITLIESQVKSLQDQDKNGYMYLKGQIEALHAHKNWQIEENRKISRRVDELQNNHAKIINSCVDKIDALEKFKKESLVDYSDIREIHRVLEEHYHSIHNRDPQGLKEKIEKLEKITRRIIKGDMQNENRPFKCPVCDGKGKLSHPLTGQILVSMCDTCGGIGIVWG